MLGNALVAMQGSSINRRAIVYCLRDVHDYICFSRCNVFVATCPPSSAQNTSAERALLSPARYRARVSQARLSRARVPFYFRRYFRTGDTQESYSRPPFILPRSTRETRTRREEAARNHSGFFKGEKETFDRPCVATSECADKRFRSRG